MTQTRAADRPFARFRDLTSGVRSARSACVVMAGLLVWLVLGSVLARTAEAQVGSGRYSSIVIDARTGRELSAMNADDERHPASLTKMMTLYMVFEALHDRRLRLDQPVPVSAHAAAQVPTKLGLVPGTRLTVEQAILGLVTKSANDAAAALGELLGGSESGFAEMMTLRAHALGMAHTNFRNASGLPDDAQVSTARDLALLARRLLVDFPGEYHYFSTPQFRFHGRTILNHDRMLQTYPGADGFKTGYTNASGFNLVTSAVHSDVRLIGVVLGARSPGERDTQMTSLLDNGFQRLDVPPVVHAEPRRLPIGGGAPPRAAAAGVRGANAWSVQVGAFASEAAAHQAAMTARRFAAVGVVHVESVPVRKRISWRAQLVGLRAVEAEGACAALARHKLPCVVLKPDPGQLARAD
jgi:D-alanyl-D-alanine carboxypeptidase